MRDISFEGVKDFPTFYADGIKRSKDEGKPVKVSGPATVALCAAENMITGVIDTVDNDNAVCVVKTYGYVTLPASSAVSVGEAIELVADGAGGVKTPATAGSGKKYRVVNYGDGVVTFKLPG